MQPMLHQVQCAPQMPGDDCTIEPGVHTIPQMEKANTLTTRRERVKGIIESRFEGNQSRFASAVGTAPPHINQILAGKKNVGEGLARRIELALSLPPMFLDTPGIADPGPQPGATPVKVVRVRDTATGEELVRKEFDRGIISRHMTQDREDRYPNHRELLEDRILEAIALAHDDIDTGVRLATPLGMYRPDAIVGNTAVEIKTIMDVRFASWRMWSDSLLANALRAKEAKMKLALVVCYGVPIDEDLPFARSWRRMIAHMQSLDLLSSVVTISSTMSDQEMIDEMYKL